MDLTKFKFKQVLSDNPTQKRIVVLGTVQNDQKIQKQDQTTNQPQAILVINAKMPNQNNNKYIQIKSIFQNDIYNRYDVIMPGEYQIQAIYPITEKHKNKYKSKKMKMVKESAQEFFKLEETLLKKQLLHIDWVINIIQGKAEVQRVLYKDPQFIILPDFKYSNLQQTQNLHLLVIFTDKNLHTIRNLTKAHINLLKQVQNKTTQLLINKFKLQQGMCRMFFHYPPTFYQLHIHVTILRSQATNALVQRAHLLQNVISNLQMDGNYYQKVTLFNFVQI